MKKIALFVIFGIFACSFETFAQSTSTTPVAAIDTVAAKAYVGKYKVKEGPFEELIVSIQNGKLFGEAVGQGSAELAPTKEVEIFDVLGYGGTVEFIRDEKKNVVKVKLSIQGSVIEAEKQP